MRTNGRPLLHAGLALLLLALSCSSGSPEKERDFPKVVPDVDRSNLIVYEVVPGSYNGGMWDGGHCLEGITRKLDQIQALGVNAIWLTPVFDGEGMGYWTRDYYRVSPKLGSLNDLKELVYEAHKRDILVLLDFVPNHTWTQHPFFQDVLRNKAASRYKDFYIWYGVPGASAYSYESDWEHLPNLNVADPEVRGYLLDVAEFWMRKLDIDGYRVDCAWAVANRYPGFGAELRARLAGIKPEVFLLGEGDVDEGRYFESGGYDGAYDWALRGFGDPSTALPAAFAGLLSPRELHATLTRDLPPGGLPFRFAENHDHFRAAALWGLAGSIVAHTIVLTSRGYPDVFGGAEVGFATPIDRQWSENDPVVWDFSSPMYPYMKKLVAIRRLYLASDLLQRWIENDSPSVYASLSVSGTNRVITVASFSDAPTTVTLTLDAPELWGTIELTDLVREVEVPYAGGGALTLTLDPYGTAVLLASAPIPAP